MLERASDGEAGVDCEDPLVMTACLLDSEDCPAACREASDEDPEDIEVKSGDLAVTARAADNTRIVVPGTSDLDTLTFKTSEEVSISKVTLERYGYSSAEDVYEVRLEDENGNTIADAKSLTKDKATLSLKKDYRNVDGTLKAFIVVTTTGNNAGGSLGFKVTDVVSSAEHLNLDDYDAHTYDMVTYSGARVTVDIKGTDKDYNYEEGNSYEVARIKATAGSSAIYVKGFTLTNTGTASALDVAEFLDEITVTIDGKEIDGVKANVNKDDELVISFDEVAIDLNKNETFVVNMSFNDDFDEYGKVIAYYLANTTHFNAVEKKTGARLTVTGSALSGANAKVHIFNGGKIKLSNVKLGNIDAAQGSEDVVVAEGNITITEPLSKVSFSVEASYTGVEAMSFVVNGEEFEGKRTVNGTRAIFSFSNVEIEKSGKAKFLIDIFDRDDVSGNSVSFSSLTKDSFAGAKYDTTNKPVQTGDVAGSISFSKVTIQAAKASLKNNVSKDVEFLYNETNRKVVFDGTYTAKKADVYLDSFFMDPALNTADLSGNRVTYYLSVDGEEVADTDTYGSGNKETFSEVLVKAGESVKVKVEAEVEAYGNTGVEWNNLYLNLGGHDVNDIDVATARAKVVTMKVKESGSVTVSAAADRNTVLLKASTQTLAKFTVKPSNGTEGLTLDTMTLVASGANLNSGNIVVWIDGVEEESTSATESATTGATLAYAPSADIPSDGIEVVVEINQEYTGNVVLKVTNINGKAQSREFKKRYEEALVYIASQENKGDETKFILGVETADSDTVVSNVKLYNGTTVLYTGTQEVVDGDDISVLGNASSAQYIDKIEYHYYVDAANSGNITILKSDFNDYFKVGSDYAKVSKASD